MIAIARNTQTVSGKLRLSGGGEQTRDDFDSGCQAIDLHGSGRRLFATGHGIPSSSSPSHSHTVSHDVQPSPEIDDRVAAEVAKAKQILDNLEANDFLASPYLVSAVYYHDGFLTDFPVDRNNADPERGIIGQISNMLSPELKARFVLLLHEVWARSKPPGPAQFVDPVDYSVSAGGRRSHKYAIDLFAPEGAQFSAPGRDHWHCLQQSHSRKSM